MNWKPENDEYAPQAEHYMRLVPEGSVTDILQDQQDETIRTLQGLSAEQAEYRYAADKWSVKEILGHINDVERLWSYRILRMARGDVRELPGYDRDLFVQSAPFDNMPIGEVLRDYAAVRQSTITLLRYLSEEALLRRGVCNDHAWSVRAAACLIVGHDVHHMHVLKTKYLL